MTDYKMLCKFTWRAPAECTWFNQEQVLEGVFISSEQELKDKLYDAQISFKCKAGIAEGIVKESDISVISKDVTLVNLLNKCIGRTIYGINPLDCLDQAEDIENYKTMYQRDMMLEQFRDNAKEHGLKRHGILVLFMWPVTKDYAVESMFITTQEELETLYDKYIIVNSSIGKVAGVIQKHHLSIVSADEKLIELIRACVGYQVYGIYPFEHIGAL